MRLEGKVALVTGAGSGNGAAIAKGFLKEGAQVVFADIDMKVAMEMAKESGAPEDMWLVKSIDVGNRLSVDTCVTEIFEQFGRIDILVANAGITIRKHFLELTEEDYDRIMRVNAKGVFLCSQAVSRVMIKQKSGSIIHISSISSIIASVKNVVAYGASKGAVLALTRHIAMDLGGTGIRVNEIAPGTILTNLNKQRLENKEDVENESQKNMLGRIGTSNDLVGAAIFLASDESSFMTGSQIVIDGGQVAR